MLSSEFNLYFIFAFISLAASVLVSIFAPSSLSKIFACVLFSFSYEVPGKERPSRGGVSFLFT